MMAPLNPGISDGLAVRANVRVAIPEERDTGWNPPLPAMPGGDASDVSL
jgi:hypothetical protein